jgi:hypothetical protein
MYTYHVDGVYNYMSYKHILKFDQPVYYVQMLWCKDNCANPWAWGFSDSDKSPAVFFSSTEDMVLFKLTVVNE